jgi:DNA invertase Pin-like site-specific DNA recombinase
MGSQALEGRVAQTGADGRLRAAQYLRMSTEHQRYSTENQAARIEAYARQRGYRLVKTYADEGISGLQIKNRRGLQALIADVLSAVGGFEVILVYDVSRWGRFQNPDQSAHYEFLCSEAGVPIEYCAEPFENDGSLTSTLLKSMKRIMAAEFSRELSMKVREGQRNLIRKGYWQFGPPGLGLRRRIVDPDGRPGAVLEAGQRKAVREDHVILTPGPEAEVALVNRIYRLFVEDRMSQYAIARLLNSEGLSTHRGTPWTFRNVHCLLTNRKYLGDLTYNRSTRTLDGSRTALTRDQWLHRPAAHTAIVDRALFDAVQDIRRTRNIYLTKTELQGALRRTLLERGKLTGDIIAATPGLPCPRTVRKQFGTLSAAYAAAGYRGRKPPRRTVGLTDEVLLRQLADLLAAHGYLSARLLAADDSMPSRASYERRFVSLARAFARVGYVRPRRRRRQFAKAQALRQADAPDDDFGAERPGEGPNASAASQVSRARVRNAGTGGGRASSER